MAARSTYSTVHCPNLEIGRTGRITSDDTQGVICCDLSCEDALLYFQGCSQDFLSSLRHLKFTRRMMFSDDADNRSYAKQLGQLLAKLVLDSITLAVPNDHSLEDDPEFETESWMWTLHTAAIRAFTAGMIARVRFAHSTTYSEVDITRFLHYEYIVTTALGDELENWDSYCIETIVRVREQEYPEPCPGTPLTLQIMMDVKKGMWERSGFQVEVDERREDEGTVLVLYRRA